MAQMEYQLPRLTRMWTHLERQASGGSSMSSKGMGEKQIEVDKRILRKNISSLKQQLEQVRENRQLYRKRRASSEVPVISLVGYTNAGKSSLLNALSGAEVLAEDKLFATLDPITRRITLPSGKEVLVTDTVGFIQKLPTQLVAAFRATLEEIAASSVLLNVTDVSSSLAGLQAEAVQDVLDDLDVSGIPTVHVWNKVDLAPSPKALKAVANVRGDTACCSAFTGEGVEGLLQIIEDLVSEELLWPVKLIVPYANGELLSTIHNKGVVEEEEYLADGVRVVARVPPYLANQLSEFAEGAEKAEQKDGDEQTQTTADDDYEEEYRLLEAEEQRQEEEILAALASSHASGSVDDPPKQNGSSI
eukprot:scaffold421_cov382-Prasinococcus_capsulatus_cf.AAC.13